MLRAHQREQFLDVDQADGVIEIFATQRKSRVPGFDCLFHIGFETVFQIEVNNFSARRHDVAHHAVTQIQHIKNKLATKRCDLGGFFAFTEQSSAVLPRYGPILLRRWVPHESRRRSTQLLAAFRNQIAGLKIA